jgi:hypothetical protein
MPARCSGKSVTSGTERRDRPWTGSACREEHPTPVPLVPADTGGRLCARTQSGRVARTRRHADRRTPRTVQVDLPRRRPPQPWIKRMRCPGGPNHRANVRLTSAPRSRVPGGYESSDHAAMNGVPRVLASVADRRERRERARIGQQKVSERDGTRQLSVVFNGVQPQLSGTERLLWTLRISTDTEEAIGSIPVSRASVSAW